MIKSVDNLEKLERNKRIFHLRGDGLKFREIAAIFGITIERVRQIYYRAWEKERKNKKEVS